MGGSDPSSRAFNRFSKFGIVKPSQLDHRITMLSNLLNRLSALAQVWRLSILFSSSGCSALYFR
jgi:hypothetical protein